MVPRNKEIRGFPLCKRASMAATASLLSVGISASSALGAPPKLPERFMVDRVVTAGQQDDSVSVEIYPHHQRVDPLKARTWNEMGVDGYIGGPFFSGQGTTVIAKDTGEEKYALLMQAPNDYKIETISISKVEVSPGDAAKVESTPRFWVYRDDSGLKLHVWLPGDGIYTGTLSFHISANLVRSDSFADDSAKNSIPALPYNALLYVRAVNGCNRLQLDYLPNVTVDGTAAARPDSVCPAHHFSHHTAAGPNKARK